MLDDATCFLPQWANILVRLESRVQAGKQLVSDADLLLERIEEGIVAHGGDLGGWTRREAGRLQLFDGRVTLTARLADEQPHEMAVHTHLLATLHDHDDEVLDACVMGFGEDRATALGEAALIWITCVAGPIKSFLDGRPVCMTCQAGTPAGDRAKGYSPGDYGLTGLQAFVGPAVCRLFNDERVQAALDDTKPWFRYARESAAPRRVHLAKATILADGAQGWERDLEIDGHELSYHETNWPAGIAAPQAGYVTRFAVFAFPQDSAELVQRVDLERTIRHFAENYARFSSVDELMAKMVEQGFDPDHVHQVESISTIAFGRVFFEGSGVNYSPTIIRALGTGEIGTDVPLMTLPTFTRARALAPDLGDTLSREDFQALCLYNAESHAIMQAMEAQGDKLDLRGLRMFPCVVPDLGASDETMTKAMAKLQALIDERRKQVKKPWWKFW